MMQGRLWMMGVTAGLMATLGCCGLEVEAFVVRRRWARPHPRSVSGRFASAQAQPGLTSGRAVQGSAKGV